MHQYFQGSKKFLGMEVFRNVRQLEAQKLFTPRVVIIRRLLRLR